MRKTRHSWPHTSNFTNHIEAISDAHIFLTLPEFITEFCIKLFFFFQNYEEAIPKFVQVENWDCNLQATEVKTTVYVDDSRFRHHNARKLKRAVHQAEESEVKKKKSSFVFVVFVTFAVEIWNLFFLGTHFKALASPCLFCGLCHIAR